MAKVYSTCDACQRHFYASESKTCQPRTKYIATAPFGIFGPSGYYQGYTNFSVPQQLSFGG